MKSDIQNFEVGHAFQTAPLSSWPAIRKKNTTVTIPGWSLAVAKQILEVQGNMDKSGFAMVHVPLKHHKKTGEPRKKASYFPLYWLVNRDPYNGVVYSLYNWVVFHPLYTLNNHGALFSLLRWIIITFEATEKSCRNTKDLVLMKKNTGCYDVLGKNEVLLYGTYVPMIICYDVSFTWFYCIQNDQFYLQRTTKAVKNCEENLQ